MGYNTNKLKERAEEFEQQYDEIMIDNLKDEIIDYLDGMDTDSIRPKKIEEIVVIWKDKLPDIGEWCFKQVDDEIADMEDQKMELQRDEEMGIC